MKLYFCVKPHQFYKFKDVIRAGLFKKLVHVSSMTENKANKYRNSEVKYTKFDIQLFNNKMIAFKNRLPISMNHWADNKNILYISV